MSEIDFLEMKDGRRIAFRHSPGTGPMIVFLPGYMSDMEGAKAQALLDWAREQGRACLLLDYSGCGQSPGDFADGSLTRWRDEVLALIAAQGGGPVVLVGSSMGGWLMLLCALRLGAQAKGLVGIAAAPDFSDWGYDADQKAKLAGGETVLEENPYAPEPVPTHPLFWQDAETHLLLDTPIPIECPVRLLHGHDDTDVPPELSLRLSAALRSEDVQVTLVKNGDHRLSRESDIALLLRTVASLD